MSYNLERLEEKIEEYQDKISDLRADWYLAWVLVFSSAAAWTVFGLVDKENPEVLSVLMFIYGLFSAILGVSWIVHQYTEGHRKKVRSAKRAIVKLNKEIDQIRQAEAEKTLRDSGFIVGHDGVVRSA